MPSATGFDSLGLDAKILRAVVERGYTQPTPIQAQAIPAVLSGGDLLAGAQTGTGKTAGFTLPILQRLITRPAAKTSQGRAPLRVLVLVPTRELAAQVEESVKLYGKYTGVTSMTVFGGVNIKPQIEKLRGRVDVLVATPGRLLDHVQQRTVDLSHIEILVLDEADRMLDMGFIRDIKKVLALLPREVAGVRRQNLLFSATFSEEIKALTDTLLDKPAMIEVARRNTTAEAITQQVVLVDKGHKRALLAHMISTGDWTQVLVFTRTKHGANRLAEQLDKGGISAMAIHGNKSQNARTKALAEFKAGTLRVLVATDIAARGLDIVELPHVVNFELPNVPEDYVHRIGRTGRASATGEAWSLVSQDEAEFLRDIEKLIKRSLPRVKVEGFDASKQPLAVEEARPPMQPRRGRGAPSGKPQGRAPGNSRAKPQGQSASQNPRSAGSSAGSNKPQGPRSATPGSGRPQGQRNAAPANRGTAQARSANAAAPAAAAKPAAPAKTGGLMGSMARAIGALRRNVNG
jgi:ATP-dependent RNA helicase RhlE